MELPEGFKQKTVITFYMWDLRALVKEVWDIDDFDMSERLDYPHNGSIFTFDIDTNTYDGEYVLDQGKELWYENDTDGFYDLDRVVARIDQEGFLAPGLQDILTALCELGKLPAGHYILDYCW